jgi:hypothetical protein
MAAAPTLWKQHALLVDGKPVGVPRWCDTVFAVLMANHRGQAGVVFLALTRIGERASLTMLDWDGAQLTPAIFTEVIARLAALSRTVPPRLGIGLFAPRPLAEEVWRLGYPATAIDAAAVKNEGMLALSAAVHIGAGRVKITAEALAKAEHHPFGDILDATAGDEDDPLRAAVLIGVSLALDEGESLKVRVARPRIWTARTAIEIRIERW